jgi:hypothetical protein
MDETETENFQHFLKSFICGFNFFKQCQLQNETKQTQQQQQQQQHQDEKCLQIFLQKVAFFQPKIMEVAKRSK